MDTEKLTKDIVTRLENELQCNCDLDNWQPEMPIGHSWVCRIHKRAKAELREHGVNLRDA